MENQKEALQVVCSTIINCEKMQLKFKEGSSQHTLLKNRLKALYISKGLLKKENIIDAYTKEELIESLKPILSIISKCEKAQLKFEEGNGHFTRLEKIIKAMYISNSLITSEIDKY